MQNAFDVGKTVAKDLISDPNHAELLGLTGIQAALPTKRFTSYADYQKIAEYEHKTGTKVTTIEEMLRIANSDNKS